MVRLDGGQTGTGSCLAAPDGPLFTWTAAGSDTLGDAHAPTQTRVSNRLNHGEKVCLSAAQVGSRTVQNPDPGPQHQLSWSKERPGPGPGEVQKVFRGPVADGSMCEADSVLFLPVS